MTQDIPFVPLAAMGSIVFAFVNFLKFLTAKDWVAARTQAITWGAGIAGALLFAHSDFGNSITIAGHYMDNLHTTSLVILGLSASSLFTFANQTLKAVDRNQTAATPPLSIKKNNEMRVNQASAWSAPAVLSSPGVLEQYTPNQEAARRAGWNPDDGKAPYTHTFEPADAFIPGGIPVTELTLEKVKPDPPKVRAKARAKPKGPKR